MLYCTVSLDQNPEGKSAFGRQVWDCRRLEKDVSFRSRITYAAQGESFAYPLSHDLRRDVPLSCAACVLR